MLFLLGVLFNSKETKRDNPNRFETDTLDYDGSGNFGRIPNKSQKIELINLQYHNLNNLD